MTEMKFRRKHQRLKVDLKAICSYSKTPIKSIKIVKERVAGFINQGNVLTKGMASSFSILSQR
jgi:hypothetical protein